MKDLNVRPETIKLLEKNRGGNKLFDINVGNIFNLTPKTKATKHKPKTPTSISN